MKERPRVASTKPRQKTKQLKIPVGAALRGRPFVDPCVMMEDTGGHRGPPLQNVPEKQDEICNIVRSDSFRRAPPTCLRTARRSQDAGAAETCGYASTVSNTISNTISNTVSNAE